MSTWSGSSLLCSLVRRRPAAENCRSDVTEVAGIVRWRVATHATSGNSLVVSPPRQWVTGVDKYRLNSETACMADVPFSLRNAIVAERLHNFTFLYGGGLHLQVVP